MKTYPPFRVFLEHQVIDEWAAGHDHVPEGPAGREELVILRVTASSDGEEREEVKRYPHQGWHAAGDMLCAGVGSKDDCPNCHPQVQPVRHIGPPISGEGDPRLSDPLSCGCKAGEVHNCQ